MLSTVRERLTEYLKVKKISKSEFGRLCGVSNAYVTSLKKTIGSDILRTIGLKFPDLNIEWLLTGEGQMLKPQSANSVSVGSVSGNGNNFVAGNENSIGLPAPRAEVVEEIETLEAIPVISPELAKAPNTDIKELVMSGAKEVKRLSIVEFFEKFGDFDAVCPTYRDSMIPTYVPGDFLFIKYKPFTHETYIKQGRYLLDTNDYGTILCIVEDTEDEYLTLTFKNTRKYKPMRIHKSNVLSVAEIVLMVRMGDMAFDMMDVGLMQQQLEKKDQQMEIKDKQFTSLIEQFNKTGDRVNRVIDQNQQLIDTLIGKLKKE